MHIRTFHRQGLLCSLILLSCCYSGFVNAHAVVTDYSFKIETVQAGKTTQVKLNFNSSIELGLSQIFLVRTGDVKEVLPMTAGQEPGVALIELPALGAGDYALHYKIFAADGHITEDVIHFSVQP